MRDILLLALVLWGLGMTIRKPFMGVYLWTWFSLMNPHRLTFGFAHDFPFAEVIAGTTFLSFLTGKQVKLNIWSRETVLLLLFVIWVCLTTVFAANPDGAWRELDRFLKIQLFIFITIALVSDKQKLDGFIWVMVLSIGYYGVKGGIFTILTAGTYRVWGPEDSYISGNNELALALLMTLPLMWYLRSQATNIWIRHGLLVAIMLSSVATLGSQSRGAFIGIMAIGLFFLSKTNQKLVSTVLVGIVAGMIVFFMPQAWWDRMDTIKTYDQDTSAMSRINAWEFALNVANDRVMGGGANMSTREMYALYAPDPTMVFDIHSIYFEILGEQGWIGFGLFLLIALFSWIRCGRIARLYKNDPSNNWASDLALMIQVSLIGYASAGTFLGLAYFDYYYDLIAISVITWKLTSALPRLDLDKAQIKPSRSKTTDLEST